MNSIHKKYTRGLKRNHIRKKNSVGYPLYNPYSHTVREQCNNMSYTTNVVLHTVS